MSTKTTEEFLEDAGKVSSMIANAHQLMNEGKTIDFPNLEGEIQNLCENADAGGLEQSAAVQGALSAIVEDLTRLNSEMSSKLWEDEEKSLEEAAKRAIDSYGDDGEQG